MNNDPRYNQGPPPGAPYPQQPQQYPGQSPYLHQMPQQYPQYPQQPPTQQEPPKKKKNKVAIGCGSIIAVLIFICIIAAVSSGGKSATSPATPASGGNNSAPAPSSSGTWTTTHTYSGNGSKKTEVIPVGNDWKIQWSCTPGSFDGIDYNVIVMVYNSDGTPNDLSAINTTCKSGNASGETEEHTGGNIYLSVTSEGDWSVTIQEKK